MTVSIQDLLRKVGLNDNTFGHESSSSGAQHFEFTVSSDVNTMQWIHVTSTIPQTADRLTRLAVCEQARMMQELAALVPSIGDSVLVPYDEYIRPNKTVRVTRLASKGDKINLLLTQ